MKPDATAAAVAFRYASPDLRFWSGDALPRLERELSKSRISRPLIVTSPSIGSGSATLDAVVRAIGGRKVTLFDRVASDCSLEILNAAGDVARSGDCDGIVAVGGGRAIVTARALSMPPSVAQRAGLDAGLLHIPYIVIPTTPTTAMARVGAAVTLSNGLRCELFEPNATPSAVLLDEQLLEWTPEKVFLDTAAATFANACEQLTTPGLPPLAHADLREAVDIAARALSGWRLESGLSSIQRRFLLAIAAFHCGRAAACELPRQATIGLALGHSVQRLRAGVTHGGAMAATLLLGLRINKPVTAAAQIELLQVLQCHVDAPDLTAAISRILGSLDLPVSIAEIGLEQHDLAPLFPGLMESHFVRTNVRQFGTPGEMEAAIACEI